MKLFIIIAGLLMLGACTGKTEGFVLKGELEGAPDDHWVFLTNTGQTHYYDSTRLKNGRFEFKGKVDSPELRCITYFKDPSQRIYGWDKIMELPIYVENSTIRVSLPFAGLPSKLEKKVPGNLRVEGSHAHDLYAKYKERVTPFVVKDDSLFDAYRRAYYYKKGTEDDVFRCVRGMDAMRDCVFAVGVEFIRQHQESPVALYVAKNLRVRAYDRDKAKEVVGFLPENVKATPMGQQAMKALLEQPLYVGDVLPDFDVLDTDSKVVNAIKKGTLYVGRIMGILVWTLSGRYSSFKRDLSALS